MWINSQAHKRIQRRLRFSKRGKYYTRMLLVGFVAAYITPFKFESKYDLEVLWTYFNRDFIGNDENGNVFIQGEIQDRIFYRYGDRV